jgi:hypothetical protein
MNNTDRKYPHLTANFLKGTSAGQIKSVHRTRATQPEKLSDFKKAIAARDITIRQAQLTPQCRQKLVELGIDC